MCDLAAANAFGHETPGGQGRKAGCTNDVITHGKGGVGGVCNLGEPAKSLHLSTHWRKAVIYSDPLLVHGECTTRPCFDPLVRELSPIQRFECDSDKVLNSLPSTPFLCKEGRGGLVCLEKPVNELIDERVNLAGHRFNDKITPSHPALIILGEGLKRFALVVIAIEAAPSGQGCDQEPSIAVDGSVVTFVILSTQERVSRAVIIDAKLVLVEGLHLSGREWRFDPHIDLSGGDHPPTG